jgi:hypothetical protein
VSVVAVCGYWEGEVGGKSEAERAALTASKSRASSIDAVSIRRGKKRKKKKRKDVRVVVVVVAICGGRRR